MQLHGPLRRGRPRAHRHDPDGGAVRVRRLPDRGPHGGNVWPGPSWSTARRSASRAGADSTVSGMGSWNQTRPNSTQRVAGGELHARRQRQPALQLPDPRRIELTRPDGCRPAQAQGTSATFPTARRSSRPRGRPPPRRAGTRGDRVAPPAATRPSRWSSRAPCLPWPMAHIPQSTPTTLRLRNRTWFRGTEEICPRRNRSPGSARRRRGPAARPPPGSHRPGRRRVDARSPPPSLATASLTGSAPGRPRPPHRPRAAARLSSLERQRPPGPRARGPRRPPPVRPRRRPRGPARSRPAPGAPAAQGEQAVL